MAKERNGFITMSPNDFVTIEGSPYHQAFTVGEEGDDLLPSIYRCVIVDGQTWTAFDYYAGPLHYVKGVVDKLNQGIDVDEKLKGSKFAAGPNFYWHPDKGLVKEDGRELPFRVWINQTPPNDPKDVVKVGVLINNV